MGVAWRCYPNKCWGRSLNQSHVAQSFGNALSCCDKGDYAAGMAMRRLTRVYDYAGAEHI